MKMIKIKIDKEVYEALLKLVTSFEDTPNDVLRRLLGLGERRKNPRRTLIRTGRNITHEEDIYLPILESLLDFGGSAPMTQVLDRVYEKMKDKLSKADLEILPSGGDVRWRNRAQWARLKMVREGLLSKDSPRGIWEITKLGIEFLKKRSSY